MTSSCRGLVREEECSGHKYVEWDVDYAWLPEKPDILSSPTFKIGTQEYTLQLKNVKARILFELHLLRTVMSENDEERCFMGVKRRDGSYHYDIANEEFQPENLTISTNPLFLPTLKSLCMDSDGHFTVFVLMDVEDTQEGRQACRHVFADGIMSGEGLIRKEECSGHIYVEWDLASKFIEYNVVNSPSFMIGEQRYILDMRSYPDLCMLNLFRMGPSDQRPLECIAGVKRKDGSHDHRIQRNDFEHLEELAMWREMDMIHKLSTFGVKMLLKTADDKITFFVLMNVEDTPSGAEKCNHGAATMTPSGEGRVRGTMCSEYVEIEWDIEYELLRQYEYTMTCPVFQIGDHRFLMGLSNVHDFAGLTLFRAGRKFKSRLEYFLGAKSPDGSHDHNVMSGELIQEDDSEFWQIASETLNLDKAEIESVYLSSDGHLTLCVWMQIEQTPSVCEPCTHDDDKSLEGLNPVLGDDFLCNVSDDFLCNVADDFLCNVADEVNINRAVLELKAPVFEDVLLHAHTTNGKSSH